MDDRKKPTQNNPMQQLSAADIMLMQAQGKEIPDRKPVQANIQKTPEMDMVISSVVEARKISLTQWAIEIKIWLRRC